MSDEGFGENTLEFGEEHFREGEECSTENTLQHFDRRIKEMPVDRLSDLPDLLLIHILSFLEVKEAGITSVLSKRWKFLWTELPNLEFSENDKLELSRTERKKKQLDFVSWVNRTLAIRKGDYLEKFVVNFMYYNECFASDVDTWVAFSVKNEVKELELMICNYKPPQILYSCSSLTNLYLLKCILYSENIVGWKSLTKLHLAEVDVSQSSIDDILSNCPVLYELGLDQCWGFNRLETTSRCLNSLMIQDSWYESYLEISAPCLHDLVITLQPRGRQWQLKGISSVVSASIDFFETCFFDDDLFEVNDSYAYAKQFLENFKYVKKLCLACECFEVLSDMVVNGWQLPRFRLQDLKLVSWSHYEHNISGIIGVLESSPNLETLLLQGYPTRNNFNLDPAAKDDLDGDLLHLKTIRVKNFADSNGEPLLTLARILFRRAPVLEKMVIDVGNTSNLVNIARTLLTYPRSSTKSEIHLQ